MKILIIGGGVMGLSCAWRLAAAGAQVELFEARACGQGASLAALGALWPASPLANGPLQQLHRESLWQFESFAAEIAARSQFPVTFRRLGRLELLNSPKAESRAHEEAAHANQHWPKFAASAPTMQLLTRAELATAYPELAPDQSALLCRATAQVHVPQLIAALRALCLYTGVILHEHTPIAALNSGQSHIVPGSPGVTSRIPKCPPPLNPTRITSLRTANNTIHEADAFLLTAGAWTSLLAPDDPINLPKTAPVRPVKGQGLALQPPPDFHLPHILKSGTTYLIPWESSGTSEILIGSTTEPEAGYDETPTAEARDVLLASAVAIIPTLKNAKILRHWAGLRPQNPTKPHLPHMGPHPRFPNLHLCTAHYKIGIGLAARQPIACPIAVKLNGTDLTYALSPV